MEHITNPTIVTCPICCEKWHIDFFRHHFPEHFCNNCSDYHIEGSACAGAAQFKRKCEVCKEVCIGGNHYYSHILTHGCWECGSVCCICEVMQKNTTPVNKWWQKPDSGVAHMYPNRSREASSSKSLAQVNEQPSIHKPLPTDRIKTKQTEPNPASKRIRLTTRTGQTMVTDYPTLCIDCGQTDCFCQKLSLEGIPPTTDQPIFYGPYTKEKTTLLGLRTGVCPHCAVSFDSDSKAQDVFAHIILSHPTQYGGELPTTPPTNPIRLDLFQQVFKNAYRKYKVDLDNVNIVDICALFNAIRDQYMNIARENLKSMKNCRVQFHIRLVMYKEEQNRPIKVTPNMESFNFTIENEHYAGIAFKMAMDNYQVRIEDFLENGSGWRLMGIEQFEIIFSESPLLAAGQRLQLPPVLKYKSYNFVNVPGKNGECFINCILAKLFHHQVDGPHKREKLESQKFYDDRYFTHGLDLTGLKFPVTIAQILEFERRNPDIGVQIVVYDKERDARNFDETTYKKRVKKTRQDAVSMYHQLRGCLYPYKLVKDEKKKHIVNMLLYMDGLEAHYLWIENLRGLLYHPGRNDQHEACNHCMRLIDRSQIELHRELCSTHGNQITYLPEEDEKIIFNEWSKTIEQYYVGAADFECRLEKINETHGNMQKVRNHVCTGYALCIADGKNQIVHNESYLAKDERDDVAYKLLETCVDWSEKVAKKYREFNKIANRNQKQQCAVAEDCTLGTICYICERMLDPENEDDIPVRHHSHLPDYKYLGWAHQSCNLNAKTSEKLVIMVHNLRGYDNHFIMRACAKLELKYSVTILATSLEKIFCIQIGKYLTILDSMNFFSDSLDNVTKAMNKETDFPLTREYFGYNAELMLSKGIYPYDYMDSLSKYGERKLPPKEAFYDSLKKKHISEEDYQHAQNVWETLNIVDMKEYTQEYNMQDVLLLLDATNNLRNVFLKEFKLEPLHHFSLPHLSWNCALKHNYAVANTIEEAEMDPITDPTMHVWFEEQKRGGVSCGGELRAAEAQNKYIDGIDRGDDNTYLMAYDVNNLYGTALCSYLPTKNFKWFDSELMDEITKDPNAFLMEQEDEQETGYTLEVDLDIPQSIHDKLQGLTPVPYKREVAFHELSPIQQEMAEGLGITDHALSAKRLVTDLYPRKNYIVSYRTLKLYLMLGVVITKVHRGVSYTQSPIFRSYIHKLAKKRKEGKTTLEKNLWKLAANAVYGKSVENIRNRKRFVIVRSREQALRYNKKPNVDAVVFLDSNDGHDIAMLRMKQVSVKLNKPLYLGVTVLDESKKILYDWYFNYAMPKYNSDLNNRRLWTLCTDTDSVYCFIKTNDIYQDMKQDRDLYDMSDYPTPEQCSVFGGFHFPDNHKKLGVMKDENAGKVMTRFIYLRPKMYTYQTIYAHGTAKAGETGQVSKGKGIDRHALKEHGTESAYLECIDSSIQRSVTSTNIKSINHNVFTVINTKKFLSGFCVKRYSLPDSNLTLPYGHYEITHQDNKMEVDRSNALDDESRRELGFVGEPTSFVDQF